MYRRRTQWQRWGNEEYPWRYNRWHKYGSGLYNGAGHFQHRVYHCVSLSIPISAVLRFTYSSPLYDGALVEQWPHIFQSEFWVTYPYFLPSLTSSCFTLSTFLICAIFTKEVRHQSVLNWLITRSFSRCHRKRAENVDQRVLLWNIPGTINPRTIRNPFRSRTS